jgi:hypothetical protein
MDNRYALKALVRAVEQNLEQKSSRAAVFNKENYLFLNLATALLLFCSTGLSLAAALLL